jgi:hypothetical protein
MSTSKIWEQRTRAKRDALLAFVPKNRSLLGKMPHWSEVEVRFENGKPVEPAHMLRPRSVSAVASTVIADITMCGWNIASFRSAKAFGLPRHKLRYPSRNPMAMGHKTSLIGCQTCYDVMVDIATWIQIPHSFAFGVGGFVGVHMYWVYGHPYTACGERPSGVILGTQDFLCSEVLLPMKRCQVCLAIAQRLFGTDRPELAYTSFTTNEEASQARRGQR